jgi:pyruvate dehydrogenase E1 component
MRSRGFLLGGTAGRTTLAGEGLQHQDGQSHLYASTIPNCVAYDPAFAYELAVIIHDGMKRMYEQDQDIFYYITVMNENYVHPPMPADCTEGILRGMYKFSAGKKKKLHVQLLGSGTILREVIAAGELLEQDFNVSADIWSVTSFNELRREGLDVQRWNLLHPEKPARTSYVTACLNDAGHPVIAATDYMKIHADQIREFVPGRYAVLGTDGFGRSDSRKQLRKFFEVDRYYVAIAALKTLADTGSVPAKTVSEAIRKYGIDPEKPNPVTV